MAQNTIVLTLSSNISVAKPQGPVKVLGHQTQVLALNKFQRFSFSLVMLILNFEIHSQLFFKRIKK